jgi:alpha/beta superfamily hydrolase
VTELITLVAADGVGLEAEREVPPAGTATRAGIVLCHPHPQFGGTMRSVVISALFEALPAAGVDCLRFNFRGVEGSEGEYAHGEGERLDALAAVAEQSRRLPAGVALSCAVDAIAGWLLIACPLRYAHDIHVVADDDRPKYVVLAQHDEFRAAEEVAREVEGWRHAQSHVVGGASHFFIGRTDHVVTHAVAFIGSMTVEPG